MSWHLHVMLVEARSVAAAAMTISVYAPHILFACFVYHAFLLQHSPHLSISLLLANPCLEKAVFKDLASDAEAVIVLIYYRH